MKAKAKRALKHLEKIKVAKWAIEALKDYFNLSEQLILEAEKGEAAQIALNRKRERIMAMLGIYVYPGITLKTVNFLYDNIEELRKEKGYMPLMDALFKLQILFDDIETYEAMLDIKSRPLFTIEDVKEQKRELNKKYNLTIKS